MNGDLGPTDAVIAPVATSAFFGHDVSFWALAILLSEQVYLLELLALTLTPEMVVLIWCSSPVRPPEATGLAVMTCLKLSAAGLEAEPLLPWKLYEAVYELTAARAEPGRDEHHHNGGDSNSDALQITPPFGLVLQQCPYPVLQRTSRQRLETRERLGSTGALTTQRRLRLAGRARRIRGEVVLLEQLRNC